MILRHDGPFARVGGLKDGIDYRHVLDGVFEGNGDFSIFENRLGEGIALQGVLIADWEGFGGAASAKEVSAIVDEEARRAVQRGVERDFDLDASSGAEKVYALVGDKLRAAGKNRMAGREVKKSRSEAVSVHLGIAVDVGNDTSRLLREGVARGVDEVAADIHEGATAGFHLVADIGWVDVEVTEETHNGAEFADASLVEKFADPQPLRSAANHEGFADLDSSAGADGEERFGLRNGQA